MILKCEMRASSILHILTYSFELDLANSVVYLCMYLCVCLSLGVVLLYIYFVWDKGIFGYRLEAMWNLQQWRKSSDDLLEGVPVSRKLFYRGVFIFIVIFSIGIVISTRNIQITKQIDKNSWSYVWQKISWSLYVLFSLCNNILSC